MATLQEVKSRREEGELAGVQSHLQGSPKGRMLTMRPENPGSTGPRLLSVSRTRVGQGEWPATGGDPLHL